MQPFARIDTVTVSGAVVDPTGSKAPFSFKVFCNAGFRDNALNLWPNLPMTFRREPTVLINADGSWTRSRRPIPRFPEPLPRRRHPEGGGPRPAHEPVRHVGHVDVKCVDGQCFLLTTASRSWGVSLELRALDGAFRETAKLDLSGPNYLFATLELDSARNRVLVARIISSDTISNGHPHRLRLFPAANSLQAFPCHRFKTGSGTGPENLIFRRYISDMCLAVTPNKYALLWNAELLYSDYLVGIQYATLSPNLGQLDSAKELMTMFPVVP